MARVKITIDGFQCERCGHEWIPHKNGEPRVCPKCKSPYWNKPRQEKSAKSANFVEKSPNDQPALEETHSAA